jgi:threonyl-tRNA synthetase
VADLRNETLSFKIRQQTLQKVPYLLVLGDREIADGTVAVRHALHGKMGTKTVAEVIEMLHNTHQPFPGD